ncbi:MAG: DUF99 family protein [Thermoplasmata archaeon]|nr:DUF99 family protein [Thermoplasmata archaeon]
MKKQIRVIGIDDGPFTFDQKKVVVVGVVMRGSGYIEGVLKEEVTVDGDDATGVLVGMINRTRHHDQLRAVMLDGVALGGFNVVDVDMLYRETGIPVVTLTRDPPDFDSMKKTLRSKFVDWEKRWEVIKSNVLFEVKTKHNPVYVSSSGVSREETEEIIRMFTIRGVVPEPLRVAHLIASAIVRGESYGKA